MDKFSRLSPTQRSNLVAYLDGELDEAETTEIETVLAQSAVARHEVELLARTYDLLDTLPRVSVTQEFTDRTLATVRLVDAPSNVSREVWLRRARWVGRHAMWTLAMVAVSSGGYLLMQRYAPSETEWLVRDLEVVERLDEYREVDNIQFLRELDSNPHLLQELRDRTHGHANR
jgi:hypothetical protein